MKNYVTFLLILILTFCLSCKDKKDSSDLLYGSWTTECFELEAGVTGQFIITFNSGNFSQKVNIYEDSATCQNQDLVMYSIANGTYTTSNSAIENATNIDNIFTTAEMTPVNTKGADFANAENLCGITWEADKTEDITECATILTALHINLQIRYDIYKIVENKLYFGDSDGELDGTTASKRPNSFNENNFLTKQ